jgi:hypothetical protein
MFTKTISPVQDDDKLLGIVIRYRLFGWQFYVKRLCLPTVKGEYYEAFMTRF